MNPNDPNQGGGSMPASPDGGQGGPTGDQPVTPPADQSAPPAPAAEEKCLTCGSPASGGNCVPCGQGQTSCTCPPASPGGEAGSPGGAGAPAI